MNIKEMTCIQCPIGCRLKVSLNDSGEAVSVEGNNCGRGVKYAKEEVKDPRRVVCSTVVIEGGKGDETMLSVKTQETVPKGMIFQVMEDIKTLRVHLPVEIGQIIKENIGGTGVNLVATEVKR